MADADALSRRIASLVDWIAPCQGTPIQRWRHRILGATLLFLAILLLLPVSTAVLVGVRDGAYAVVITDVAAYGVLLSMLLSRRIPYVWRAGVLLGLLGAVGAFFTISFGPLSSSMVWLLALPVASSLLLGLRAGTVGLLASMTCVAYVAVGIARGTEAWAIDANFSLGRWLIIGASLFVMGLFLMLATAVIATGLGNEATARASAESERARLVDAMEQSDGIVILIDPAGQVTYANAAARAAAADRMPFAELAPWTTVLRGDTWSGTLELCPPGTEPVSVSGTLCPVRDADGTLAHVLATLRDVRRERALEDRLRHDQRLAAIGTLAGGIAHDFNNLLQPISGNAEVARAQLPAGHPAHAVLGDIEQSAERARVLVRRILSFSRTEREARGPLDLGSLVHETVRLLRATVPPAIEIETAAESRVIVEAEPGEVQQVLLNLASNAAHAMPRGGTVWLDVRRVPVPPGSDLALAMPGVSDAACLRVADSGNGMDAATLRRIFEPFFSTKRGGQGSGLGLAMVHATVTGLGGIVLPESAPGIGTTMRVYLPLTALPLATPIDSPAIAPAETAGCIMVVDDEDRVRRATVRLLERHGWSTVEYGGAADAIAALGSGTPSIDAILTDFSMPGMTGTELARVVRTRVPTLPVVLMTGFVESDDAILQQGDAVTAVIAKPFTSSELRDVMERVLSARPGRADTAGVSAG
ncbi:MAG: ATP-binding protein [Gemmatimonadota bacterium]|nr:ATP-binding protein [Gemmatimonadota bacterium]